MTWEYSCCNTSLLSRYEKYCIIIAQRRIKFGNKNKKHLRGSIKTTIHLLAIIHPLAIIHGHHTDRSTMGLGQYNSLREYCDPRTASFVFLILIFGRVNISLVSPWQGATLLVLAPRAMVRILTLWHIV